MTTVLSPSRTIVTNFGDGNYEEGVWVLELCSGENWLGCALTNGNLQVYDTTQEQRLMHTYDTDTSSSIITDLSTDGCNALITSSKNGAIRLYDVRQPTMALQFSVQQLHNPNKMDEALSVDLGYGGALAAVGTSKAHIHFFDLRAGGKLLGTYQDAHTDEVTRIRFQPDGVSGILVSASEDGLACIFDTSQPSEETALQGVLNINTPIRKVGFFGPSYEGVYCLTGSETLSVWHHDTAQRICDFGGASLRQELSSVAGMPVDYLVDCHWSQNTLSLLTGSHSGDGTWFQVDAGVISPLCRLQNGHKGDIRSSCRIVSDGCVYSGGEDARICQWNPSKNGGVDSNIASKARTSSAPARRPKSKTSKHSNPY